VGECYFEMEVNVLLCVFYDDVVVLCCYFVDSVFLLCENGVYWCFGGMVLLGE